MIEMAQDWQSRKNMEWNIRGYILLNLDLNVMLVPVIMILWLQIGLTFNQVLLLQGIFVLVILLFEVPSGALADSRKRKSVVVLGQLLMITGVASFLIANDFWWCAIAEVSFGIGQAMISGALEAMLYDSLLENGRQDELQAVVRKERIIGFTAAMLLAPLGGIMGDVILRLPLLLIVIIDVIIIMLVVTKTTEPERIKARSAGDATVKALGKMKNPVLIGVIIFSMSGALGTLVFWGYQNLLVESYQFTPSIMGLFMATLNLMAAASTWFSRRFEKRTGMNLLIGFMVVDLLAITMIMVFRNSLVLIIVGTLMFQFTRGSRSPVVTSIMQKNLQSSERATFISLNSMQASLGYLVMVMVVNLLELSLIETLLMIALLTAVIIIIMMIISAWISSASGRCGILSREMLS